MKGITALLALVLVAACGGGGPKAPLLASQDSIELLLFAAPPCIPCTEELRQIETLMHELPNKERLQTTVFVETGKTWADRPTPQSLDDYRRYLGIGLTMVNDGKKYETYRRYYSDILASQGLLLPACVVQKRGGPVFKIFAPGTPANEIAAYLKTILK